MPRTGRGGARAGTPGASYTNRTDLRTPERVRTAPNQPYGAAAAQRAAQGAMPLGPTPAVPGAPAQAPPGPGGAPAQGAPSTVNLASLLANGATPAGARGGFFRPTERPGEPVTHGLSSGVGAGPEILQGVGALAASGQQGQGTLSTMLQGLASQPGASSSVQELAKMAMGGQQ